MTSTLRVRNWRKYQHYKDRRPPWIKFYDALLDDEDFTPLPKEARLLFPWILLLAARKGNRLPANPVWLAEELALPLAEVRRGLGALLASNYVINGSSESATPETETDE